MKAIGLGAPGHIVLDSRAAVYEKMGCLKEALIDSRAVIKAAPDLPKVRDNLSL